MSRVLDRENIGLGLLGLIVILALGAGSYAVWYCATGEKAWLAWKAERAAKGEHFDWVDLIPPSVPDNENFAAAPIIAGAIGRKDKDSRFKDLEIPGLIKRFGDWRIGRRDDLATGSSGPGSQNFMSAFESRGKMLGEIEQASRRPRCKFPVDYAAGGSFEMETQFFAVGRALRARALCYLASNQIQKGFADLMTMMRIAGHFRSEPSAAACIMQWCFLDHAINLAWEGIQDRRWDDHQLEALQAEFSRSDLLALTHLAGLGERLYWQTIVNNLPAKNFLSTLYQGWLYRSLIHCDKYLVLCNTDVIDPNHHRVFPENWISEAEYRKTTFILREELHVPSAAVVFPAGIDVLVVRSANIQSGLDQAAVACALERFRLAKGGYPASLAELAPAFMPKIPHDLVNGQPLKYERVGQSYILYSIGWDLKDDGGVYALDPGERPQQNLFEGDWPWIMTATPANARKP